MMGVSVCLILALPPLPNCFLAALSTFSHKHFTALAALSTAVNALQYFKTH